MGRYRGRTLAIGWITSTAVLVSAITLLSASGALALPSAMGPDALTLALAPSFGPPTATSTATGKGFEALESVNVFFDSTQVASTAADSAGGFSVGFTVPTDAQAGGHMMSAVGTNGDTASANFLVRTAWPQFRFDEGHTGLNPYENTIGVANAPKLTLGWSRKTGGAVQSSPTYFGGVVVVGSSDGILRGILPATNKVKWSDALDGPILAAPVELPPGPPTCPPGPPIKIFAATDSSVGGVYGLSTAGRIMWQATMGAPVVSSIFMQPPGPPTIPPGPCDGMIVVADQSGLVRAFDAAGDVEWSAQVAGSPTTPAGSVDTAGQSARVFVTTNQGNVYGIDVADGSIAWSASVSGAPTSPAVTHGFNPQPDPPFGEVVLGTKTGDVDVLDGSTGDVIRTWSVGGAINRPPAIGDVNGDGSADLVLSANLSAGLHGSAQPDPTAVELIAYNDDGSLIWEQGQAAPDNTAPALANGMVLLGSDDHDFHVYDWSTGSPLFSFPTKKDVRSAPMIADGRIVFGSNDDHLYELVPSG